MIQKLIASYKLWLKYWPHFDKLLRHNLGARIDRLFIETIEHAFLAGYSADSRKGAQLNTASDRFDLLKLLLRIAWEVNALDNKKYIALSEKLGQVGRMLGGWQRKTNVPARDI